MISEFNIIKDILMMNDVPYIFKGCLRKGAKHTSYIHCIKSRLPLIILVLSVGILTSVDAKSDDAKKMRGELPEIVIQNGHSAPLTHLVFSPDERLLASSSYDGTVKIWDVRSGRLMRTIVNSQYSAYCSVFSARSDHLAVVSGDHMIRYWDPLEARLMNEMKFTPNSVTGSDGRLEGIDPVAIENFLKEDNAFRYMGRSETVYSPLLGTGLVTPEMKNWRIGKERNRLTQPVRSPSGRYEAAPSDNGDITIKDLSSNRLLHTLPGRSIAVRDVSFSSDSRLMSIGLGDGSARLVNLEKGLVKSMMNGHKGPVHTVSFGLSNDILATASYDGSIRFWHVSSGQPVSGHQITAQRGDGERDISRLYSRREKGVTFLRAPRGLRIISPGSESDKPVFEQIWASAFIPDRSMLAYGGYRSYIRFYDYKSKQMGWLEGMDFSQPLGNATIMKVSPDSRWLAIGEERGAIRIVEMQQNNSSLRTLKDHGGGSVEDISFADDAPGVMVSGASDGKVTLWDLKTGKSLKEFTGNGGSVFAVCLINAGTRLLSAGGDGIIKVWNTANGKLVDTLNGHISAVNALDYSSKLNLFLSGSEDGTVRFWNAADFRQLTALASFDERNWIAFDIDGFFEGTTAAFQRATFRFPSAPRKIYEPEQFFYLFFQPGLLSHAITNKQSVRRMLEDRNDPRADLDISAYRNSKLPEVRIINPEDGFTTGEREIPVNVEAGDTGSGLRDLRVFRNQTLVHFEDGELTPDPQTRKYNLPVKVKLVAGENEITAYAFNRDNIKSKDAPITVHGAKTLARKGTAYVLAVGINQYSNTDWNLNFAVNDAAAITDALDKRFKKLNTYAQIIPVTLLNKEANKANLLTAFELLSGAITSPPPGAPEEFKKLRRAEPEDDIIIYFSGHGMADRDRYYLIPHDMGYQGRGADLDKAGRKVIMKHSLSDQNLNEGFEKIDAGRMMLIIDACQSGQALESEEKRRGPMNSRGLAQLAYEKGMYILAAAQSYQAAREFSSLGHGLLTYTLIEEGLQQFAADNNPKDNQITAEEWLDYATQHTGREVEVAKAQYARKKGGEQIDGGEATVTDQSPRAYYRRERMGDPWVVTKYR